MSIAAGIIGSGVASAASIRGMFSCDSAGCMGGSVEFTWIVVPGGITFTPSFVATMRSVNLWGLGIWPNGGFMYSPGSSCASVFVSSS